MIKKERIKIDKYLKTELGKYRLSAFITACYTGMRSGEVCALTWNDIDLKNKVINIKHTVYDKPNDGKGRWYIGPTKTKNGTRQINISPTLFQALVNYKNK